MRIVWDPHKSAANLALRGFDFGFAAQIFAGPVMTRQDLRRDYGEPRMVSIGTVEGHDLAVVYTDRWTPSGLERRIISARRSSRRERETYQRWQES